MDLITIPGVGRSLATDLHELGFHKVEDLRGANPRRMFEELCSRQGVRVDRCVLYVFRSAVYFAETEQHEPQLLKWWNWKNREMKRESGKGLEREATG